MSTRCLAGLAFFLLLVAPVVQSGQNPAPTTTDTAKTPPLNDTSIKSKKIWTNDDLRGVGPVSVVGDKRNQNYHMSPAQTADPATVSRIRKSLETLNTQLEDTNQKLAQLKSFQTGETVNDGGRQIDKGINRVPVDQQIAQLQDSKKKLQAQIGDLWDQARKTGIDPGQLR
jgi:hypothetical protein